MSESNPGERALHFFGRVGKLADMVGRIFPLALLLSAVVATAQDRVPPAASATPPATPGAHAVADTVLPEGLVGAWRVRWPKNGWEATRIINRDGTFTSSDAGAGTWAIVDQTLVLSFPRFKERYELPLKADGTKVIGYKDRELVATKQDSPGTAPKAAIPATPKTAASAAPVGATVSIAELVKTYRKSLVFVTGASGSGSGFLAEHGPGTVLFTNAHVAARVKGAAFKTLDNTEVKVGPASCAVGHDIFLLQAAANDHPLQIMTGVDEHTALGDEVVVLGNAEGAGVINSITGKIVGLGPQLVEVDAPFQPGNSGSPIIHLKSGKVIAVATYAVIRKYDPSTKEPEKKAVIRRFGYRLDSIKSWQPVNWSTFSAQAAEMEDVEKLTGDLAALLDDLAKNSHVTRGTHNNPVIKNRIDSWLGDRAKRLSPRDAAMADQSFLSFLKITCQTDVTAARQHMTYDYFQRELADQQRERDEIAAVFSEIIQNIQSGK